MNTQKKLYLLPHRCQLIGWILVGVSLVFAIGSLLFIKGQSDRETYAGLGVILSFIGLFLAGLSRERQEDEFTVFLRTRSALTAVAFMFAFRILLVLIMLTMGMLTTMKVIGEEVFLDNRIVALSFKSLLKSTGFSGAFVLYLLLYKIRLARYYKEVNDEE